MKISNGLIKKLIDEGVVERRGDELRFRDVFCTHLARYSPEDCFRGGQVEGWRKMFKEFIPSLSSLSDEDIATTTVLLDYFLNVVKASQDF
jgi:hypothetical protein